jgi:electron transfer flavoprotein alpha subunit
VALCSAVSDELLAELAEYGASSIYVNTNEKISNHGNAAKADFLTELITSHRPDAVLLETSVDNKEIAGRVSVLSNSGVLTDVSTLEFDESEDLIAHQDIFGGFSTVISSVSTGVTIATVHPNDPGVESAQKDLKIVEVFTNFADSTKALTVKIGPRTESSSRPKLTEAKIIIGAGRGVGDQENFKSCVEGLADALGAAIGATQAVIDLQLCPSDLLVGQSGATVSPDLYFALGISGAIHHLAGMQSARCVVAIDIDENAPMLHNADLGIVGDVSEIVPRLIEVLNKR